MLSALLAIPSAALAKSNWLKTMRVKKAFLIRADESRFSGEQEKINYDLLRCVVSCEDNDTGLLETFIAFRQICPTLALLNWREFY